MDHKKRLAYLLSRRHDQSITKQEEIELARLILEVSDAVLSEILRDEWERLPKGDAFFEPMQSRRMLESILTQPEQRRDSPRTRTRHIVLQRFAAAAAVLLFIAFGLYLGAHRAAKKEAHLATHTVVDDALPAGNKATLTLSGGKRIILDSADNGLLATLGGISVEKTKDGQLTYQVKGEADGENVAFNTLSTPRGGQYEIILPDGSKVWLNAASSLRFPSAFVGKERKLELTGEAYFEVASNPQMPFKVAFGNTEVEVLGTHFNIMAYDGESAMKTTLLEGAVKITAGGTVNILEPGQQASVPNDNGPTVVRSVDVSEAVAWKNGLFQFNDADLQSVMREAARWYDLDIRYEGEIPKRHFTGRISRNVKASEMLSILKYTGVNFRIEGKEIVVM